MKKVQLNTISAPIGAEGTTEAHYGAPFTVTKSKDQLALVAELEDDEADAMIDCGRVIEIEVPKPVAPAAKATEPAKTTEPAK